MRHWEVEFVVWSGRGGLECSREPLPTREVWKGQQGSTKKDLKVRLADEKV